jgi:hypothetical protein
MYFLIIIIYLFSYTLDMSLNKFTDDSVRQEWANIGCNRLNCETVTASSVEIDSGILDKFIIAGDVTPQLSIESATSMTPCVTTVKADEAYIYFEDDGGGFTGSISSTSDGFIIDPQTRVVLTVENPVSLRNGTHPLTVSAGRVALYPETSGNGLGTVTDDEPTLRKHIKYTQWIQTEEILTPPNPVELYISILKVGGRVGEGSLIVPGSDILNHCYALRFAGTMDTVAGVSLKIGVFRNDVLFTETPFAGFGVLNQDNSFDGIVYIKGYNDGTFKLDVHGDVHFSNGSAPLVANIPHTVVGGASIDSDFDVRLYWSGVAVPGDVLVTRFAALTKLY